MIDKIREISPAKMDLERLYKMYPRKQGKAEGLARLRTQIKSKQDYDAFEFAVQKYREHLEESGTERQYIMHFSTFVGTKSIPRWRDWLEDDCGEADVSSSNPFAF